MNALKTVLTVILLLFLGIVNSTAHAIEVDDAKQALVGARDIMPDMQVSYTCLYRYGPHPSRLEDQRTLARTSLSRKYLTISEKAYDRIIQGILDTQINPDGSTEQEYFMNSYLSGEKLKTIQETGYGPIALFGRYRILIADGKNVSEGQFLGSDDIAEDRYIWFFSDPVRKPNTNSSLRVFDGAMFPPSFFGYKPGELLKEGCVVNSVEFYADRPEIAYVTLNDPSGRMTGYFEIDTTKGLIATRGLFYLTSASVETYNFIQYELYDIQEVCEGFYFPQRATILTRTQNPSRSLPDTFVENPQPTESDKIKEVTFSTVEIIEQGIPDEEFIAPVKAGDQVDEYRSAFIERANEGFLPYDLRFDDWILDLTNRYRSENKSIESLSGGIAGPEYNYLNLP